MSIINLHALFVFITFIISSNIYSEEQDFTTKIKSEYWQPKNQQNYTKDNIYDYINGEANIHFAYNFQKLNVIEFESRGNSEDASRTVPSHAFAEVYSYGENYDAYGIFSLMSRDRNKFNDENRNILYSCSNYNFIFLKGNYFVVVRTSEKHKEKHLIDLGISVANMIKGEISFPPLIKYIPEKNTDKINPVYFHDKKILNQFKHFNKNIFGLDEKTNAVITRCAFDEKKALYLLIEYPDNSTCLSIYKTIIDKAKNILNTPEIFIQRIEKTYLYVSRKDKFIVAIINTHNEKESVGLIRSTLEKLIKYSVKPVKSPNIVFANVRPRGTHEVGQNSLLFSMSECIIRHKQGLNHTSEKLCL